MQNAGPIGKRLTALFLATVASTAGAEVTDIQPGVEYRGHRTLRAASVGITFDLPAGFRGGLPQDSEYFLMAPDAGGGYIFAGADEMTVPDAGQAMSERVPLGDGLVLSPSGKVEIEANALVARYEVEGADEPLLASAKTIVGDHGTGIYLIAVYPREKPGALPDTLERIADTVRFQAPVEEANGSGSVAADAVRGRKITRFFTGSGYTETETLYLCSTGAFYRNAESGGYGWNASGAFQSDSGGQWSVEGATLVLRYGDGTVGSYDMSLDGSKLMLDGRRWFREPTDCR